jgi:adenylate cyclase
LRSDRAAEILLLFLQRHGELISKNEIMDAAWPDTAVEESNLTVQISALRRALDEGRTGTSCIQTVPGRGYRFALPVIEEHGTRVGGPAAATTTAAQSIAQPLDDAARSPSESFTIDERRRSARGWRLYVTGVAAILCAIAVVVGWPRFHHSPPDAPARLSVAVLPFANSSGERKDSELADAVTDDFMTSLAQIPGSLVAARSMSRAIAARKLPLPSIGSELAVRYVLEGNIRRLPDQIEVDIQFSDAASGTSIWTSQFRGSANEPGDLRSQTSQTLMPLLWTAFLDAEARRISSLPAAALTADDLLLLVRASNSHLPISPRKSAENTAMLERALALDPRSGEIIINLAFEVLRPVFQYSLLRTDVDERLLRARALADRARALVAGSPSMLSLQALILRAEGRFDEALAAYTSLMQLPGRYRTTYLSQAAWCLMALGRSAEAIPLQQEALRLDRGATERFAIYNGLGLALNRVGRYDEAVKRLRAAKEESSGSSPQVSRNLAIAYAHTGRIADAWRELQTYQQATRTSTTAHRLRHGVWTIHGGNRTPGTPEEQARDIEGLLIAGLPDHASEDADSGLPITEGVRSVNPIGQTTPIGVSGISTIRTPDLQVLIGEVAGNANNAPPLLLSTDCSDCLDIAIPGTVFVPDAFHNGVLDDENRRGLKAFVDKLLGGNQTRRLITFSWNVTSWESRNLAIELVALGYPNVSWYRGGLEAWDVAGLPVTKLK